jgi:hypothetical protein
MMNFMGPSRDNPTPQSPAQKGIAAGVIVAVLAVAGTVWVALSDAVDRATLVASIGDMITLPFVLTLIGLCFLCIIMTIVDW